MRTCIPAAVLVSALVPGAALGHPTHRPGAADPVPPSGPALAEPESRLAAAMSCGRGVDGASRTPVLLVHGTGATVRENWSWTYQPAFDQVGIPWCAVQLPERGRGDLQVNAEYVVYAVREMHRRSGRAVSIVGQSQGGMLPRWALKFWPDTRAIVDDQIGLAPSNHGTTQAQFSCGDGSCTASHWQQWDRSAFVRALNSPQETFAGISYTAVYTHFDEVVTPPESAVLRNGDGRITNVAIQDICPADPSEHFTIGLFDPVAYALVMDALENDGPASVERVRRAGCAQPAMPGTRPHQLPETLVTYTIGEGGAPDIRAEPPLRCYVTDTCASAGGPGSAANRSRLRVSVSPRRPRPGRRTRFSVAVRARVNSRMRAVHGARVRFAGGRRVTTNGAGRARVRIRVPRRGVLRVTATAPGYKDGRWSYKLRRRGGRSAGSPSRGG